MKRWGVLITVFYFAAVLLLVIPGFLLLDFKWRTLDEVFRNLLEMYREWWLWLWVGIIVGGQALLLFLSVDTAWRHAKPRQHVAVTAALTSFFAAVLTGSALFALEVGVEKGGLFVAKMPSIWIGAWILWGVIFYQYYRDSSNAVSTAVSWLLKGSVLELLIAVPAHIVVRQRGDCSAPAVTGFGIVTGIAIMLLCFGPGVLALYKKKLDAYARRQQQNA